MCCEETFIDAARFHSGERRLCNGTVSVCLSRRLTASTLQQRHAAGLLQLRRGRPHICRRHQSSTAGSVTAVIRGGVRYLESLSAAWRALVVVVGRLVMSGAAGGRWRSRRAGDDGGLLEADQCPLTVGHLAARLRQPRREPEHLQ